MRSQTSSQGVDTGRTHKAGAFDIRTFIALLIGLYGLVLVLTAWLPPVRPTSRRPAG